MKLVCANVNKSIRLPDAQVISRYKVGQSSVTITSDGRYIVHEPALTFEGEKIYREMQVLPCFTVDR